MNSSNATGDYERRQQPGGAFERDRDIIFARLAQMRMKGVQMHRIAHQVSVDREAGGALEPDEIDEPYTPVEMPKLRAPVAIRAPRILDGCTFSFYGQPDPCLARWRTSALLTKRGIYGSGGLPVALYYKSSVASEDEGYDAFIFGGPVNFRGYFPGHSVNATIEHDFFTWAILKAHPRNAAGTVTLRSADPLDPPEIVFNSFNDTAGAEADLQALFEAVGVARRAFAGQLIPVSEVLPGHGAASREAIETYARDVVWGHHASSTCPIGADGDPMAVLDASFRVRGAAGLRVVDASVYPRIPGVFTAVSTYMVAEKAADVILAQQ